MKIDGSKVIMDCITSILKKKAVIIELLRRHRVHFIFSRAHNVGIF